MDIPATLMLIFGPVLTVLMGVVVYFLKRTVNTIDAINRIMPTLMTIPACDEKRRVCEREAQLKENGEHRVELVADDLFKEKWNNLMERIRAMEKLLFRYPQKEADE